MPFVNHIAIAQNQDNRNYYMPKLTVEAKDLNLFYGNFQALKNINFQASKHTVTAFIGPSGCGKSTLLRVFNRMNDLIDGV